MTSPTNIQAMDIDHDTSSSTKSETPPSSTCGTGTEPSEPPSPTKSEKDHKSSVDTCKTHAPRQASILDPAVPAPCNTPTYLQDAVVTTLHLASPETLEAFLNPTVHVFKAIFTPSHDSKRLVVWRKGIEVFVGTYLHHTTMKSFGFEHVAGLLIGYDGSWHLKVTAGNSFSSTKWAEVWAGDFECYGGVTKMVVERDEGAMQSRAFDFADSVMKGQFWEAKVQVTAT